MSSDQVVDGFSGGRAAMAPGNIDLLRTALWPTELPEKIKKQYFFHRKIQVLRAPPPMSDDGFSGGGRAAMPRLDLLRTAWPTELPGLRLNPLYATFRLVTF